VRLYAVSEKTIDKIGPLSGEIAGLQTKRNRALHDKRLVWRDTREVVRLQVTAEHKLQFGPQPETTQSLKDFAEQILAVRIKFDNPGSRPRKRVAGAERWRWFA
jgi:hypothetical protein